MNNLENGLILLVMGMGFVLVFLTIMIISMRIMSKIVGYLNKIFPEAVEEVKTTAKKVAGGIDEIALAIAAVMAKRN